MIEFVSNHVKGYIIQILQDKFFIYHNEIDAFILSISGQPAHGSSVASKIHNFVMQIPEQWGQELIERTASLLIQRYQSSSENRKLIIKNYYLKLRELIQRTMNLYLDDNAHLSTISPAHTQMPQQQNYIETKLREFGLNNILTDFIEANNIYQDDRRSPISQLRNVFEGLTRELVTHLGGTPTNMRQNLEYLESRNVLISTPQNHPDHNLEVNFSYKLFGLLSHYGSHPNQITEGIIFSLFLISTTWIFLVLKRYELIT